jgi:hypothetical protein
LPFSSSLAYFFFYPVQKRFWAVIEKHILYWCPQCM